MDPDDPDCPVRRQVVPRTAELLDIPQRTFERHWATTRAWLYKQVS